MKVKASLWFVFPGTIAEIRLFNSVKEVLAQFRRMRDDSMRFGSGEPVGVVYAKGSYDIDFTLEVGPRGGIRRIYA